MFNVGISRSLRKRLLIGISSLAVLPSAVFAQEVPASGSEERAVRKEEIIVTARSLGRENEEALPVQVLAGDELAHRRQGGLGETLAGLPGVHLDNFGGGASRPVIRGQTVPRIEILTDGANLFDVSSVSPDHAITTDPLLLDAIEVQRGPAAVRYGGNALNGAINLIDSKVPRAVPEGNMSGAAEVRYGTGDEEKTVVGRVTAGLGQFAVHAEGSRRVSEDYDVPNGFGSDKLRDSFADGTSYSLGASWITSRGYIGGAYTRQDSHYGLPGHSHANGVCHLHAPQLHCEAHGSIIDPFEGIDDSHTAAIDLRSERVDVRADYEDLLPGVERARLRLSYTDYQHDEVDGDALFSRFGNEVYDARLELTHAPLLGFTGTLGAQYTDGKFSGLNYSDAHLGGTTNRYDSESAAIFLSERRSFGAVDVEVGGRYEWRKSSATYPSFEEAIGISPELLQLFDPSIQALLNNLYQSEHVIPKAQHDLFSLSGSANWSLGRGFSVALSLARSERAPGVRELYAGGNNLATNSFEVGLLRTALLGSGFSSNPSDIKETAQSVDLTFRKVGGALQFEVGLFYQDIDDYVFARFLQEEAETGVPHRLLLYTAADARFLGIDGQISYQFTPSSTVTVFGDYVDAKLKDDSDELPRIPPGRLGARYEGRWGSLSADAEVYRTFAQEKFASYETRTGGYNIANATIAYRLPIDSEKSVEFYLRGTNLTNELAFAHTSFAKDQSPLRGRNVAIGMRHQF